MEEPLDSRQLRAFVVLAKTGSYTETARQLFVTHSAISHAMRALESTVGCRLLNNVNKKVMLTDAGEALLQHAQHVLEEMQKAKITLGELNKWGGRRLRISAEAPLARHFLVSALAQFHQKFPRVVVSLELHNCCDTPGLLASRQADLVFSEQPLPDAGFEFFPLFSDCFHVVVSPGHHWAIKGSIAPAEFPKAAFILHRHLGRSQKMIATYLARNNVVLNTVAEIDSLDSIKDFVRQTQALTILPTWAIARELKDGSLAALPLGRKALRQSWGFTYRRDHPLSHSEASIVELCRRAIAAMPEHGQVFLEQSTNLAAVSNQSQPPAS